MPCFATVRGGALFALNAAEVEEVEAIKVVSATGYEQNIADAPASVYVVTKEELENKSFNDLTEVLKNVPGVFVNGGSVFKDISIRGMGSGYTLYLIDGKPVSGDDAHSPNGMSGGVTVNSLPPISAIERIEVIRGPMSSLYGSEAMGGVINIITKKTPQEWSGSIKGEYTKSVSDMSNDGYQGSFNIAGPVIKDLLSLQTYGSILHVDEANCPSATNGSAGISCGDKSSAFTPQFISRQFGTKLTFVINDENSVWANYDYSKQEKKETPGVSTNSSNRVNGLAIKETYSLGHDLKTSDFILNTYIQDNTRKNPTRGKGIDYGVLTANTQGTYFFETNALTLGAQYRKETLDDRATNVMQASNNGTAITSYNSYEVTKQQYALFGEDEWSISDNFALTGGFRVNNYEDYGTHFTPRLYAVYNLANDWVVKGGVSGGYKVPSLRQSADDFGGVSGGGAFPPVVNIGSPDVKPESSMNYEVSLAYSNQNVGLDASVTVYHTKFKDKIEGYAVCDNNASTALPYCNQASADFYQNSGAPVLDVGGGPYSRGSKYHNIEGAEIEGLEVTLNYDILSNLAFGTTYTYTKSERDDTGKPLNDMSKHLVNVNLDYQPTGKLGLWGQYNYRGKYIESESASGKGYSLIDVGTVYKLRKDLKVMAGIYNLLNKEITSANNGRFIDGRRVTLGFNADF